MKRLVCQCKQTDYFKSISAIFFVCLAFNWCGYWWKRCSSDVPSTWRNNPLSARCLGPLGFISQFQWCHVAVVALKLWNCFNSLSQKGYTKKKMGWGTCSVARKMEAKAKPKALVLAGLGDAPWDKTFLIFAVFCFLLFFLFFVVVVVSWSTIFLSLLHVPHRSDRFRHCWY